ncbi:hypothetical protein K438DRAFT_1954307 [Mycena galopus ATCC 62051]|nr:hypothetical protein K438DRAFT_1954307 [Mycena galopus ATCC 62051]
MSSRSFEVGVNMLSRTFVVATPCYLSSDDFHPTCWEKSSRTRCLTGYHDDGEPRKRVPGSMVAVSLSTLWAHIDTELPLPLLRVQLDHSKGCGLTIRLIYSEIDALDPLVDCSSRWEIVDIQMGPQTVAILDRVHGKVPILRKLKCSDGTGVGSCAAFEIAPNLSSVTIIGKAPLRLPWTH